MFVQEDTRIAYFIRATKVSYKVQGQFFVIKLRVSDRILPKRGLLTYPALSTAPVKWQRYAFFRFPEGPTMD